MVSCLHRPSIAALLAKDLVAEWLHRSKFGRSDGVWLSHVLPAVLSFLQGGLDDVLMLPDQDLPKARSSLKVRPQLQDRRCPLYALLSSCSKMPLFWTTLSRRCIKGIMDLTASLRIITMFPVLAVNMRLKETLTASVWQALWERLLSISDSVQQSLGPEHGAEALKPLVNFWMQTVRPQPETLLTNEQIERDDAGEKCALICLLQLSRHILQGHLKYLS